MTGRHRVVVGVLLLAGVLAAAGLVAFASVACPIDIPERPCPQAGRNIVIGVALAALAAALLVTPFAFLAEVLARRRIVYRGTWARAARRGALAALLLAALAGLRLGGALNVPTALFLVVVAVGIEWLLLRRDPWR